MNGGCKIKIDSKQMWLLGYSLDVKSFLKLGERKNIFSFIYLFFLSERERERESRGEG